MVHTRIMVQALLGWVIFVVGVFIVLGLFVAYMIWFGKWTGRRWARRGGMHDKGEHPRG